MFVVVSELTKRDHYVYSALSFLQTWLKHYPEDLTPEERKQIAGLLRNQGMRAIGNFLCRTFPLSIRESSNRCIALLPHQACSLPL